MPHGLLISALYSVVLFCDGLYLLQREALLMRSGSLFIDYLVQNGQP